MLALAAATALFAGIASVLLTQRDEVGTGRVLAVKSWAAADTQHGETLTLNHLLSAPQTAANLIRTWGQMLEVGARQDPTERFANVSSETLTKRLRQASHRYDFKIVNVKLLHPAQVAPFVVVRTQNKNAFALHTPSILRLIDPKRSNSSDVRGWAYEGFLLEAIDAHNSPFLIVFNSWRGQHAGGGQWATSSDLYPFPHG